MTKETQTPKTDKNPVDVEVLKKVAGGYCKKHPLTCPAR